MQGSLSQNPFWAADADFFLPYDDVVDEQLEVGLLHVARRSAQFTADCGGELVEFFLGEAMLLRWFGGRGRRNLALQVGAFGFEGFEAFGQRRVTYFHKPGFDHFDQPVELAFGLREVGFELTELAAMQLRLGFCLIKISGDEIEQAVWGEDLLAQCG